MAIATDQVIAPTEADVVELQSLARELCRWHFQRIRGANIRPPTKKPIRDGVCIKVRKIRRQPIRRQPPRASAAHEAGAPCASRKPAQCSAHCGKRTCQQEWDATGRVGHRGCAWCIAGQHSIHPRCGRHGADRADRHVQMQSGIQRIAVAVGLV